MRSSLAVPVILQPAIRMHQSKKRAWLGSRIRNFGNVRDSWNWQKKRIQTAIRPKIVEIHQNVCFVENRHFFVEIFVKTYKIEDVLGVWKIIGHSRS